MRLPEFIRTTTFRWTLTISAVFFAAVVVLTTFVFHQVIESNKTRIDGTLVREIRNTVGSDPKIVFQFIQTRLSEDPRRVVEGVDATDLIDYDDPARLDALPVDRAHLQ